MEKRLIAATLVLIVASGVFGLGVHLYFKAGSDGDRHVDNRDQTQENASPFPYGKNNPRGGDQNRWVQPNEGERSPSLLKDVGDVGPFQEDVPAEKDARSPPGTPPVPGATLNPKLPPLQLMPEIKDDSVRQLIQSAAEAVRSQARINKEAQEKLSRSLASGQDGDHPKPKTDAGAKPFPADSGQPSDLEPLVTRLKRGTTEEKIQAAEELARLGEHAKPASRALCDAALGSSEKLIQAALVALEKANSELHQPVLVLLVDSKAENHYQALAKIALLGEQGKPALPVVLFEIKRGLVQLLSGQQSLNQPALIQVVLHSMEVIPEIAPEDMEALKTLITLTRLRTNNEIWVSQSGRSTSTPFRDKAVELLGNLVEAQPNYRKQIIPALMSVLKEAMERTNASEDGKVIAAVTEISLTGNALLKCGTEGKEALENEAASRLKQLKFHQSDQVRKIADTLQKKIEASK
jgi:hypothetical protein